MKLLEILKSIVLGIVEGITEWLPVSSTGHMILIDEFLQLDVSESFSELFFVVIQLGAICAVPILFWNQLYPFSKTKNEAEKKNTWILWAKVIVGAIPAAIIGVFLDDFLEEHFYNYAVVAAALIVYGVAFIALEIYLHNKREANAKNKTNGNEFRVNDISELTYADALRIGVFQVLSLIPGTSRSGSTLLGGMLTGVSRKVSAEFSFFMAIPIMIGASLLKILKFVLEGFTASGFEIALLLIGMLVSFIVSLFVIKFLMDFVKRHDLKIFGYYRILLGILVLGYFIISGLV